MARLPLTGGFTVIPEGTYVFYIYSVEYDEDFGKMIIKLITADGKKHQERFSLKNDDDTINEKAMNAFSFFAKTAINNFDATDIDTDELVGHYIRAEIVHTESVSRKDGTTKLVFANIGNKTPAEGFDDEPCDATKQVMGAKKTAAPAPSSYDLDTLLG